MVVVVRRGINLLTDKISANFMENYVAIWEGWPVSPGVSESYVIEFLVVCEVVEIKIISPFY